MTKITLRGPASFYHPRRKPAADSGQTRFTLVELLVVISIISLLAGMLLPVLAKAKRTAQGIACMSKIRQLSLACTFYHGDNSGYLLPSMRADPGYWGPNHVRKVYLDGISGKQINRCPAQDSNTPYYTISKNPWNAKGAWASWAPGYSVYYEKVRAIENPAVCCYWLDDSGLPTDWNADNYGTGGLWHAYRQITPHNGRMNIGFVDAHTAAVVSFKVIHESGWRNFCDVNNKVFWPSKHK